MSALMKIKENWSDPERDVGPAYYNSVVATEILDLDSSFSSRTTPYQRN